MGIEMRGVAIGGDTGGVRTAVAASAASPTGERQTGHEVAPGETGVPHCGQVTGEPDVSGFR
ncbi:MAG: hypothetical protein AAB409_04805 [Gemmatimonadota bacterium]